MTYTKEWYNSHMKRRNFLQFTTVLASSKLLNAQDILSFENEFLEVSDVIESVQEHMFPKGNLMPSAKEMNTVQFLFETMAHKSFNVKVRRFILEGARWFNELEKGEFLYMTHRDKEYALRRFEKRAYGKSWLSYIMTLTLEAMLSDPIYGSNINEVAWLSLGVSGGYPRPKEKYLEI